MSKTKQPELLLQAKMIGNTQTIKDKASGLRGQGFYAEKQSERFKAGRPDLRLARKDVGQCDFELKYLSASLEPGVELGFTKLQWLKLKEMNEHGIPAVGLVYVEQKDLFFVTLERVLYEPFISTRYLCSKLPAPQIIDGVALFGAARGLLNDAGYRHRW